MSQLDWDNWIEIGLTDDDEDDDEDCDECGGPCAIVPSWYRFVDIKEAE